MKLHHYLPSSPRNRNNHLPIRRILNAVCACGLFLGGSGIATASLGDDAPSALLTSFDMGETAFSLSTGLDAPAADAPTISLSSYPRAGWQAQLSTFAHGVSGTVTIVDEDTFRVDDFFYDGGGIQVHFILATQEDYTTFRDDRLVTGPDLLGTPHSGDSVTIDLPAGMTLDGFNAISLWCLPARANFGSGTFIVPEPGSASMLMLGAVTLGGWMRRRPKQVQP